MVDREHPDLSVRRQCELLGLAPSSYYHRPQPLSALDLELMRLLDEQYLQTPFYGVPRMTWRLVQLGYAVGQKRVRRLLRVMGLMAIYPKPRLSLPGTVATVWPYLVGSLQIDRPDVVWATDITYIRLAQGFCYLCVVMDWHSRFVLSWRLSTSLDSAFCLDALEDALAGGRKPFCFNSDQGSQFTSEEFVGRLLANGIKPSWDGKGRYRDNIFVERFWRTFKYECAFLHEWINPRVATRGIGEYMRFYNNERPHSSLDKVPPAAVYYGPPN